MTSPDRPRRTRWLALSILVVVASIDEVAQFHDHLSKLLRESFNTSGALYHPWVVPAALVAVVIGLLFARFLYRQHPPAGAIILAGAALYVVGNIGLELLEGLWDSGHPDDLGVAYTLVGIQEFFEMLGAIIVMYGLLSIVKRRSPIALVSRHRAETDAAAE